MNTSNIKKGLEDGSKQADSTYSDFTRLNYFKLSVRVRETVMRFINPNMKSFTIYNFKKTV